MEHTRTGGLVRLPKSHQDEVMVQFLFVEQWAKVESDAQAAEKEGGKTVKGRGYSPLHSPPNPLTFLCLRGTSVPHNSRRRLIFLLV